MNDQVKIQPSTEHHGTAGSWYPLRKWWEPSPRFNQESGLLPLLELGGPRRMEWLQRPLTSSYWPWYSAAPLFVPHIYGPLHYTDPNAGPQQYKWRVNLDMSHFSPSEISLSVKDGFLQVGGRHEERPDEHGSIARCFTRKYRLPQEIDATKIASSLSADGILTVEAPVPEPSIPDTIIIPIKVEEKSNAEVPSPGDNTDDHVASGKPHDEDERVEEASDKSDLPVSGDQEGLNNQKEPHATAEGENISHSEEKDES